VTIEEALRVCGGRVAGLSGAAARLGIARSTLDSRIQTLKINKERFRPRPHIRVKETPEPEARPRSPVSIGRRP
jgi:Bacterial regulatory protein, Fis family